MLTTKDYDDLINPIIEIYNNIEIDLIKEIASMVANYDELSGSLEWYVKKLDELGGLNQKAINIIAKYSGKTEAEVKKMLSIGGYASVPLDEFKEIYDNGGMLVDPTLISIDDVIRNTWVQVQDTYKLINTKAIQGAKQAYMNVINQSYIEVSSGVYDYQTSIKRALEKMVDMGIQEATYDSGYHLSIESAVRRDTLTAVNKVNGASNDRFISEMEAEYVEVSTHEGARNKGFGIENHEEWQGKVYKIEGSTDEYPNLEESTGYDVKSHDGDILGLHGVNCRHNHWAFFPGYSVPKKYPDDYDTELYDLTQKQRYYERMIRKWKKRQAMYETLGDEKSALKAKEKTQEWQNKLQQFVEDNPKLKRDYNRERVVEQYSRRNSEANYIGDVKGYYKSDEEILEIAKENETIIDNYVSRETKWSGRIVTNNEDINRKEWSCDISLDSRSPRSILMHEQLHARSVSYYDEKTYKQFLKIEESSVEILNQEICKENDIEFLLSGYEDYVSLLRDINKISKLYDNDKDFAISLFNQPLITRLEWLENKAYTNIMKYGSIDDMIKFNDIIVKFYGGKL